ncbi:uncharacterized protein K452DRAFT_288829 [Aplosporella prunicola CBS 121167]|uniref:Uncharacterized protein n=1 Tax=Aplosporella prunicola CBS 121167 TaxID=1176127 RepID=A0A6A6B8Z8_9PEZI|nr:uncharacterized protein K452DRAFT_288829 [Aplosporella prunicola CBS 121167]KAF2140742.1 hypothetical protein K452DRAFT_288829 [Aplosporella prunicola CBS 121167]
MYNDLTPRPRLALLTSHCVLRTPHSPPPPPPPLPPPPPPPMGYCCCHVTCL